jgi:hypothetical protein|tara:strand:+ start:39 stop:278 length:240 start_codon:yes stop_codon:yes gene_type:complete
MTKEEINFKLAMTDELLIFLNIHIKATQGYLNISDDSTFIHHKKRHLHTLKFFKDILTCKDSSTFFDLTSCKPKIKKVI